MRHEFKFAFGLVILGIIFLFAFCPVGKSDPHTLNRWPANTVIVDAEGLEGVKTITAAYNIAAAGDEILIYPGTYTESLLIISKAVTFTGMGGNDTSVVWQGDSLLWSLQTDGVVFNNIYFKALRDGQLANVSTSDWRANNCSFDDSTWTFAKDDAAFVNWRDVHLYPRKMGGTGMTNGTVYCEERFMSGVPVGEPVGPYYGLIISSGVFHCEDKANIYANTDTVYACLDLTGDGAAALQEGALIGVQGGHAKSVAVRVRNTSTLLCNGGDFQSNSADSATLRIYGGDNASVTLQNMRVKNSGGGNAYTSQSDSVSYFMNVDFTGGITPKAEDTFIYNDRGSATITIPNPEIQPDSGIWLVNYSGYDWTIIKIVASGNADNYDFELGTKSLVGAAAAITVLDTIDCSVDGADGVTFWKQTNSTIMDNTTLPSLHGIWFATIGAETPDFLTLYIEWTVGN